MIQFLKLFAVFLLLTLTACGGGAFEPANWQDPQFDLAWPEPPDDPRIRYLRSINGPADFRDSESSGGVLRWLIGESQDELPLLSPYAVVFDPVGIVWVADSGARMLYKIDLGRKEIDYVQMVRGERLNSLSGLAIDVERQRLYLADAARDKIFVLDMDGEYVAEWAPPDRFKRPAGMTVGPDGKLYVADALDGTVAVFNPDGSYVKSFGSQINLSKRFHRPLNVAIGPAGELLIVDALAFRIEVQNFAGELIGTIGKVGDGPGSFARPRGVAVNQAGQVFVTDAAFDNLQVFDLTGTLLMYMGNAGSRPGDFNLPAGVFSDREGRVFVADSYNHRVQVFQMVDTLP
jgi:DNA-binding beta-propeller fold protein YncE